jgi:DNA-binding MarR family transcriptional regulator
MIMKLEYSDTYLYKLHTLTNALDKLFAQTLRQHVGIGLSQFTLLLAVGQHEPVSQRNVSVFLEISPAAISRQVDIAQRDGLLLVQDAAHDRRSQLLRLTPAGKTAINAGLVALEQHAFQIFVHDNRQMGLMQHVDALLTTTKEAIREQDVVEEALAEPMHTLITKEIYHE